MGAEFRPRYVAPDHLERHWPWIGPLLAAALVRAPSETTLSDIYEGAKAGTVRLWVVSYADGLIASAAAVGHHEDGSVRIYALGGARGSMRDWIKPALWSFEAMARQAGHTALAIKGRVGWVRWLQPLGFQMAGIDGDMVEMRKAL